MDNQKRALRILMFNSAVSYVLAFLLVFIPSQILTFLAAVSFDIPTRFSFFKIDFPIADYSNLWNQQSIVSIYSAAPVVCIFIAIYCLRFFKITSFFRGPAANLLVIWMYAHSVNILLGGILVGIPLVKGSGFVATWLFFPSFVQWLLVVVAVILLFFNGIVLRYSFMALVPSIHYLKNPYLSLTFKLPIVFLPAFVVNLIFFFVSFPDNSLYEKLLLITMFLQLFFVIPFNFNYFEVRENYSKILYSKKLIFLLLGVFASFIIWRFVHNALVQ